MAKFVCDDPLEFVAGEFVESACGDGDHRIAGGETGGKGVDPGFLIEHVDGGHGHA